jgi:Flp pilus assembly protein TadD
LTAPREALAETYASLGRHRNRLEQLEGLAVLEPERPVRLVALGLAQADAGRTDLAVFTLGRAAERQANDPLVYSALADVWLRLADRGDLSALGKALEASRLAAMSPAAGSRDLLLYGRALLLSNEPDHAARILREATERYPLDPDAFLYLASVSERRGRLDEARRALTAHVALVTDDRRVAASAARLGELAARTGDAALAARWLTRAAQLQPHDAGLLLRLASAQLDAGDADAARRTLDRALDEGASSSAPAVQELAAKLGPSS